MPIAATHGTIRGRLLSMAAIATLVAGLLVGLGSRDAAAADCSPYPDVSSSNVHCENIAWLKKQNITKPADGNYHPSNPVTRGSMAAFLFRLTHPGKPAPTCTDQPFPDVPTDYVFCGYIDWAVDNGITVGYPDGEYKPDNGVTRGAMAAFLQRVAVGHPAPACTDQPFRDVEIGSTFCKPISWMKRNGITYGVGDGVYYGTTGIVNRQSMASFLHRIDNFMHGTTAPTTPTDPTTPPDTTDPNSPDPSDGLAGRYFTGMRTVMSATETGYYGVAFVDDQWAYWGRIEHGMPHCTSVTGSVDVSNWNDGWGCVHYSYDESSGALSIGGEAGHYDADTDKLTLGQGEDQLSFATTTFAAPDSRFDLKLQHWRSSGVIYPGVTVTGLALGNDGKFVLSEWSLMGYTFPGGGAWAGSFPPDEHGTYEIKSRGRIVLHFADGSTETQTFAIELDDRGRPDADDSTGNGGLYLGLDWYSAPDD